MLHEQKVARLQGMLHKRHQHSMFANWGKRYFEVDDEWGILYYFRTKAAQEWDEPARHFKLSALRECKSLSLPSYPYALELTLCDSPRSIHRLVLRADSETEQRRWLTGLQSRIHTCRPPWKQADIEPPRASRSFSLPSPRGSFHFNPSPRLHLSLSARSFGRSVKSDNQQTLTARPSFQSFLSRGDRDMDTAGGDWPSSGGAQSKACEGAAGAIAEATLAATRAAARAEAALLTSEMCQAMGCVDVFNAPRGKRDVDIERFLEQRQQEVWAQLEEEESHLGAPNKAAQDMLAALGATPDTIQGIGGGGGRSRRGTLTLDAEAMERAVGLEPDVSPSHSLKENERECTNSAEKDSDAAGELQARPGRCGVPLAFGLDLELDV